MICIAALRDAMQDWQANDSWPESTFAQIEEIGNRARREQAADTPSPGGHSSGAEPPSSNKKSKKRKRSALAAPASVLDALPLGSGD